MEQKLFEIMKRASIFVILAQTIIHFCPKEAYEKYLRLLVSLMTITVMVFPVVELFHAGAAERMTNELNKYNKQMEQLLKEEPVCGMVNESQYLSTITNEIKTRLNKISKKTGYSVESVEIQGISQKNGIWSGEAESLRIIVKSNGVSISTGEVDKIKCSGNTDKSTRNRRRTQTEAELCGIYAKELSLEEADVEVSVHGTEN